MTWSTYTYFPTYLTTYIPKNLWHLRHWLQFNCILSKRWLKEFISTTHPLLFVHIPHYQTQHFCRSVSLSWKFWPCISWILVRMSRTLPSQLWQSSLCTLQCSQSDAFFQGRVRSSFSTPQSHNLKKITWGRRITVF